MRQFQPVAKVSETGSGLMEWPPKLRTQERFPPLAVHDRFVHGTCFVASGSGTTT
jgi:hypothetical protein